MITNYTNIKGNSVYSKSYFQYDSEITITRVDNFAFANKSVDYLAFKFLFDNRFKVTYKKDDKKIYVKDLVGGNNTASVVSLINGKIKRNFNYLLMDFCGCNIQLIGSLKDDVLYFYSLKVNESILNYEDTRDHLELSGLSVFPVLFKGKLDTYDEINRLLDANKSLAFRKRFDNFEASPILYFFDRNNYKKKDINSEAKKINLVSVSIDNYLRDNTDNIITHLKRKGIFIKTNNLSNILKVSVEYCLISLEKDINILNRIDKIPKADLIKEYKKQLPNKLRRCFAI